MSRFTKYLLIGTLFWVVVDYTTAFNPDFERWIGHMPLIWFFYIGVPAFFAYLIYRRNWRGRQLLGAMLFVAIFLEVVLFKNALLYTFPILMIMIPVAFAIYGFITYVPFWIVEGTISRNRNWVILLTIVWLIVSVLNYQTTVSGG